MTSRASRGAVLAVGLFALVGLIVAGLSPSSASLDERTREVARTLKCLTCIGEDVANSTAPVAEAMRVSIAEQLDGGRTPDQIRTWFADRYGSGVLLDPPAAGYGWWLWLLPAALIGGAVWVLLRRGHRRSRWVPLVMALALASTVLLLWHIPPLQQPPGSSEETVAGATTDLLSAAVSDDPGNLHLRVALALELEREGQFPDAAKHLEAAARLAPMSVEVGYLRASALARSGEPEAAIPLLERVIEQQPNHLPSLLLLGTLQVRQCDPVGVELLERFLALSPEHPAAAGVRDLIRNAPEEEP